MERRIKNTGGQIIIEILIAFGLASILLPAILTGFISGRSGRVQQEQRSVALGLLKEAEEAVRVYREADWNTFADGAGAQTYHPEVSGSTWILASGEENPVPGFDGFTRSIVVDDAFRDGNNFFAQSGTIDYSAKKITLTVSWGSGLAEEVTTTYYLTRWKNLSFSNSDSIEPSGGGFGDWCKPTGPSETFVDLIRQGHPTSLRARETVGGLDGNRILAGTGANASGPAFSNVKILGDNPNITYENLGDYNGTPQIKVNGLISDADLRFAYLATDSKQVAILDLQTTPYQQVGSFALSGNVRFSDVYVVGDVGYALTQSKFYIFSISPDRTSTSEIGSIDLSGGERVYVDPNSQYAYVANSDSNGELKIIDVHSNPASLSSADIVNVNVDAGAGKDVFVNEGATRAYLATAYSATQPEFFIIDITDKANPVVIPNATYDTSGMDPKGVAVVSGNRAIIVGVEAVSGAHEYQVFIVDGDEITFCPNHAQEDDFLNIDSGIYALSTLKQLNNHAYSYIATGNASAEIEIIEGGPGGGSGSGTGVFESQTFDAGHDVVVNSFTATPDPDLSYKVSIKHGVSGSCATVTYSDSDFMTFVPGPLPIDDLGAGYVNPGQCLRYQVVNSGGSTKTFDISFNYSP